MPAKRSPRKSHRAQVEVTTAELDALAVTPATPAALPDGRSERPVVAPATTTPPPSWAGRSVRGGSTSARAQSRRYAFRRS